MLHVWSSIYTWLGFVIMLLYSGFVYLGHAHYGILCIGKSLPIDLIHVYDINVLLSSS